MGLDLYGRGGYFRWTGAGWFNVLTLAEAFGWQPTGTRPGRNAVRRYRYQLRAAGKQPQQVERAMRRWRAGYHGLYSVNDGQEVTSRDARHLADALSAALKEIEELFPGDGTPARARRSRSRGTKALLASFADGDMRGCLAEFIEFCAAGRFEIN